MPAARVSPAVYCQRPPLQSQTTTGSNSGADNDSTSSTSLDSRTALFTPYQRVVHNLHNDERWQKEIALGRRIGFYRFRGELGTGNFSQVKVAVHCLTKEKVAVKILDKAKLDQKTQRMLIREMDSMEALHHPNIIRLFEVIETLSKIYLVMEVACGGELFQRISMEGPFTESEAKPLFAQMVAAVEHMHQHNIIHRDIKAENVFFSGPSTIKLGDFGFSTRLRDLEEMLSTFCGSPPYAAPELFRDESYAGPYVDIWALGVLLYFIVTGTMPFKAQTVASLKRLILEGDYTVPSYLSDGCAHLIKSLLHQEPRDRWTVDQIKQSDWLRGQTFPSNLEKPNMSVPSSSADLPEDEVETRRQLAELGITDEMIVDNSERGIRSSITGSYRIVLHKIQWANFCKKEASRLKDLVPVSVPRPHGFLASTTKRFSRLNKTGDAAGTGLMNAKNRHKSRTCTLL